MNEHELHLPLLHFLWLDAHFLELFWNYVNGDLCVKGSMSCHCCVQMEHGTLTSMTLPENLGRTFTLVSRVFPTSVQDFWLP